MKRAGLFLAAFLLISGMLRVTGPGATAPAEQGNAPQQKANTAKPSESIPKIPYLEEFAAKINEFYGVQDSGSAHGSDIASYFQPLRVTSSQPQRPPIQFAIAIFPDPIHTRLGLSFDRSAEAVQQAAQTKNYDFDRAIMPWGRTTHSQSSDLKTRQEERDEQAQRESYPGLMIFRRSEAPESESTPADDANSMKQNSSAPNAATTAKGPLFVLVVGETPTAGLNRQQFRNALQMIHAIRATSASADATKPPLLIMGPSFSGSLESLGEELQEQQVKDEFTEKFVYSGTVTATNSMRRFEQHLGPASYFASFQENDDYARDEFLRFASSRGYKPYEIAILSEDGTVFGAQEGEHARRRRPGAKSEAKVSANPGGQEQTSRDEASNANSSEPHSTQSGITKNDEQLNQQVLKMHFPREISYFRSAYQKETSTQSSSVTNPSGVSTLPLNLEESGNDDDTVAPYAVPQTSLSQEAVMLGIVSELEKHHIKFTLLFATDPLDELFLAEYLRKAYAQGRVVITAPDLLFAREGDPALRGVLGLNTYALVPGLGDRLCRQKESLHQHEDRLFVSSLSAGIFNATVGLLSLQDEEEKSSNAAAKAAAKPSSGNSQPEEIISALPEFTVPYAPYAEYGSPNLFHAGESNPNHCEERPLLWLTILGRDGFWVIAGLNNRNLQSADWQVPLATLDDVTATARAAETAKSTLKPAAKSPGMYGLLSIHDQWETKLRTPPAWNIAYLLCLILLAVHAFFSWSGSVLADSEDRAQFTRNTDSLGAIVLALGALALASAFVLVMCIRSPRVDWVGTWALTAVMWLPYPIFVGVTIWDLYKLRRERVVARAFIGSVIAMTIFQFVLTWISYGPLRVYWSTRMLHIASGLSPALPVLLLIAAAYWWMWLSLRGVCLVDLRRPRLPERQDLALDSYRISDAEGEDLRKTAHPLYFTWQVAIPVIGLGLVTLLALGRDLPVESVEGKAFDVGFTVILCVMVSAFLGCLTKLVRTWQKCHQVLAGLDRLPLRSAFGRMKELSWHSFWNPGGSTLRETYKVMMRAIESMTRLLVLVENWNTPMKESARRCARIQIRKTLEVRQNASEIYARIMAHKTKKEEAAKSSWWKKIPAWCAEDSWNGRQLRHLMARVEELQKEMAKTAAILMSGMLQPIWDEDETPAVSSDERIAKPPLQSYRAIAEEYVALVYVNFLVSVLLRIRTLVISAGGMYVFIVLSMNVYPFEPHPALQTLAVVLLVLMGGAVGSVYAGMHRETILSHLTSTEPGELGLDFWIKFASAGAIPVFSLLAAQFPSINQFLFSWLEPALQAMK
ncbi:MAG: hypothetical protein WA765_18630 [Candidatus Acidiferrum sp.]